MSSGLQTLNEMTQLRETGFGMPWPRHGLKLLYWFSTRCISFDGNNEMVSRCDPRRGHFGFHRFINRPIEEGVTLLPVEELQYYVLGNVNFPKADQLPEYVRKNRALKGSNKDRIIISLDAQKIRKVYITTHIDNKEFDINNTFLISRDLLTNISLHQDVEDFLCEMDYSSASDLKGGGESSPTRSSDTSPEPELTPPPENRSTEAQNTISPRTPGPWKCACTIL
ncbi:uncharacterized protein LOC103027522 isoform X1 [Astyanax mexicanus]|uniref:uncharacterized protein LOC103027522 isoform X1 n=1 Tax=Astyanax mexicanus TaxID=7994 RepID=UPI000440E422|nr:uncharacterized protein LOC103027522 isoform X1 [Astyanax mexicanus]XP_049328233.1 uncharacterized protein LOC103027522 isoform X1 [Astyanax mexicanus]